MKVKETLVIEFRKGDADVPPLAEAFVDMVVAFDRATVDFSKAFEGENGEVLEMDQAVKVQLMAIVNAVRQRSYDGMRPLEAARYVADRLDQVGKTLAVTEALEEQARKATKN